MKAGEIERQPVGLTLIGRHNQQWPPLTGQQPGQQMRPGTAVQTKHLGPTGTGRALLDDATHRGEFNLL